MRTKLSLLALDLLLALQSPLSPPSRCPPGTIPRQRKPSSRSSSRWPTAHRSDRTRSCERCFYEHKTNKQKFPRLQLRTVKELMEGKGIERPTSAAAIEETFKKTPESKKKHGHQTELTI